MVAALVVGAIIYLAFGGLDSTAMQTPFVIATAQHL